MNKDITIQCDDSKDGLGDIRRKTNSICIQKFEQNTAEICKNWKGNTSCIICMKQIWLLYNYMERKLQVYSGNKRLDTIY